MFQGELRQRDRGEQQSKNPRQLAPAQLCGIGPALTRSVRHQRRGEGRRSGLMRRAKTLCRRGMEVLIEEERISPYWIVLEAGVCSMRRPPAILIEQKETQKAPLELRGDPVQIRLFARSCRQFYRQIVTEEVMEMPE